MIVDMQNDLLISCFINSMIACIDLKHKLFYSLPVVFLNTKETTWAVNRKVSLNTGWTCFCKFCALTRASKTSWDMFWTIICRRFGDSATQPLLGPDPYDGRLRSDPSFQTSWDMQRKNFDVLCICICVTTNKALITSHLALHDLVCGFLPPHP